MGPWGHATNAGSKLGEVDFGPDAIIDLREAERKWFDRWLKGIEGDGEPSVRIFVMGENKWRDEAEWPLARAQPTLFYLHSDGNANSRLGNGRLSTVVPGDEKPDQYRYDPARPVPFITEPTSNQIGGPDDYAAVERRDDAVRGVLRGQQLSNPDDFYRLRSAGVMTGDSVREARLRCQLYASYLEQHLR